MDNLLGTLGLLYKGHKAIIGAEFLERMGECHLILCGNDLNSGQSQKTMRKIMVLGIKTLTRYSQEDLGAALGKEKVSFLGIIDKKTAASLLAKAEKGAL